MPKIIELTFELKINRVSCPGVWLCQDGMVSLSVFALGSKYETCLTPPIFPLVFKEVFYFRRQFQDTCNLNNIFCLLKDEIIYCELVQWYSCGGKESCTVLAQYLGALNDVLFPSGYCSMDEVDLLMRRSKRFPGILAPKIEISTRVRIDEIFESSQSGPPREPNPTPCYTCNSKPDLEPTRQRSVCHTPMYHRTRCEKHYRQCPRQSRSFIHIPDPYACCDNFPQSKYRSRTSALAAKHQERCREYHQYHVFNVDMPSDKFWKSAAQCSSSDENIYEEIRTQDEAKPSTYGKPQKPMIESRFLPEPCNSANAPPGRNRCKGHVNISPSPCICDICRTYHEMFHAQPLSGL